jgi:hypothetical protein
MRCSCGTENPDYAGFCRQCGARLVAEQNPFASPMSPLHGQPPPMPLQKPQGEVLVFILGLLGILVCAIFGVFAWIQGNDYLERCRIAGVPPEGLGVAGRILGIISTAILALSLLGVLLWLAVLALALGAGAMK